MWKIEGEYIKASEWRNRVKLRRIPNLRDCPSVAQLKWLQTGLSKDRLDVVQNVKGKWKSIHRITVSTMVSDGYVEFLGYKEGYRLTDKGIWIARLGLFKPITKAHYELLREKGFGFLMQT